MLWGPSWSWLCGSWIYNYLCNQCLSPLTWVRTPFMARCTQYNIIWSSLSVTCGRSMAFSRYSGFLHQLNWPPWYNWNIVENGDKHDKPNQNGAYSTTYIVSLCCPNIQILFYLNFQVSNKTFQDITKSDWLLTNVK